MTNVDALAPVGGAALARSPERLRLERVAVDQLAERVPPTSLARDVRLPVLSLFESLIPDGGVRRGTTVAVSAQPGVAGATSLAFALAAGASHNGSWVATVGLGSLGLVAASEMGVALQRLVLIARPGHGGGPGRPAWLDVVAALVDGFDVVLMDTSGLRASDARPLVSRVRERSSVLVAVGADLPGQPSPLRLTITGRGLAGPRPRLGASTRASGDRGGRRAGRSRPGPPG